MAKNQRTRIAAKPKAQVIEVKKSNRPQFDETFKDLDYPYHNERERIKFNTAKYSDISIREAFEQNYGVSIKTLAEFAPVAKVDINDFVELRVLNVTKDGVELDSTNLKMDVQFVNDLYRLPKFNEQKNFPINLIAKVLNKKGNTIYVDPLASAYDTFIANYNEAGIKAQYNIKSPQTVTVRNLRLMRGGYIGNLVVPELSDVAGKDMTVECFIPGSQIVQNIEKDFDKWVGKSVEAFVTTIFDRKDLKKQDDVQIVCSRKSYLKHIGNINIIEMFKAYCEQNDKWRKITATTYKGTVTGVINTAKKCGVFVEIPQLSITTLINKPATELVNYKSGEEYDVKFTSFEEPTYENEFGQIAHNAPYVVTNDVIEEVSVKPILEFV